MKQKQRQLQKALNVDAYINDVKCKIAYVKNHFMQSTTEATQYLQPHFKSLPRIITYHQLHLILLRNYQWCHRLNNSFVFKLNDYHTSSTQLRLNYQYYQHNLFDYLCIEQSLEKLKHQPDAILTCMMHKHNAKIRSMYSNSLDISNSYYLDSDSTYRCGYKLYKQLSNRLKYVYSGNYNYYLLTTDDKPFINLYLIHNKYLDSTLQRCIIPLLSNISSKRLANLSNINVSKIKKLRKPYKPQWKNAYNSLTYLDAKHLCNAFQQHHYSRIPKIKSAVDYRKVLTKQMPKILKQSKPIFKENRANSLKDDELDE